MHLRRATFLALALLGLARASSAQESVPPVEERQLFTRATHDAVEGALRWLAARQNADGSWNARIGFKINDEYSLDPPRQGPEGLPHIGVTALAGMAFLSGGHLPGEGPYGKTVRRAMEFVLANVREDGFITTQNTRMYSHAFCVLFLAELYGMTGRADLREKLDRAVEFTYKSQNEMGGWRYAPGAQDSDMSITVCQVVALREARNIGIRVPKATIDRALKYVLESAVTGPGSDRGAFLYQHQEVPFNRNSFALTAAGLTTIYQAGLYSDADVARFCASHDIRKSPPPSIRDCLSYLLWSYKFVQRDYQDHYFYFYGNYYAAQAMYTCGGSTWRQWYAMVRDDLLEAAMHERAADGVSTHWRSHYVGETFSTAVCAIILQVPKHYLPIFQR
ncbi:MAG: prenyltransferase/squalene oxidase repeat-containing protein [Planctomycetota bacterium]